MERIKSISIIGVGLIGASLGLALKKANLVSHIIGIGRKKERLKEALTLGAIDAIGNFPPKTDVVVLATPINAILEIGEKIDNLKIGAIVMDVGSTKKMITNKLTPSLALKGAYFVGTHPLAGSEKSKANAARCDLFKDAVCVITPISQTNKEALSIVRSLWENIGAKVLEMPPERHDELIAYSSHLPHIIASSLMDLINLKDKNIIPLLASGFKDTTRIAASDPIIWRDICLTNCDKILKAIGEFKRILEKWEFLISDANLDELTKNFKRVKMFREKIK